MSKILVTGGAGFIGSHLCERLLAEGNEVYCLDNFFTGQRRNIKHLLTNKNFTLIEHDIIDPFYLDLPIDQVYNLACPASPVHYQQNPIRTVKANTKGMINMLGLAKAKKARLLQASTSEVYGDPEVHPQPENYKGSVNCLGPRACYDEGKRVAETLCMDYHREHNLDLRLVRIFNTYGPRMHPDDGRVVSNFILQALRHQPITIYGDGSHTRSFCFVDDNVEGLIRMMNQSKETGPVNIGNPDEVTMSELANQVIKLIGTSSKTVYKKLPEDDPKRRQPDITKAKELLDWQPTTPLQVGLTKTIAYFQTLVDPAA
ncbi:MAG: NAD-dependent dehydratase [Candidatus Andersenbacteria bacterium RIFCSPHIGHO2_12_FULL_46_9]|nr:MAG: DTDP-glucose 4,6 dehydratase [Parcubacteria group bacterium GW2011_GWA2_45_14]OGY35530.1 MAG: NAD-dependent dehydratase [Candidatus Andersenbacteria bacterium RIFCSPHIGHO2_02_FULL_46_16]OGY37713.1 MAG: NAD-dependent dehydratase [Candidatus Andersenbacteria bacterium RIFCSPHIGHO2_12_FULL_46_9]OGY37978.1 MAG: NAD-dependent dehydratase [Candidatus Andersenbacteria bacterium RIFCSPLOWO2_02_FULL_46_11]OGY41504.1 MAG: NAD-dependent dehydratase [Candidatus Andersenbacteria bacterium RIFCSPLOWO